VVDGDLLDFPGISKFTSPPGLYNQNLEQQLNLAYSFLSDLRTMNPNAEIYYVEGNHDFRMRSFVIRETIGMPEDLRKRIYERVVNLEKDLDLARLGIEWVGTLETASKWTDTYIDLEGVIIGHFDVVANPVIPAGMTIRRIMSKYGHLNMVQAHVHRAAILWDTDMQGNKVFGMEVPALCQAPTYRKVYNWQFGYGLIKRDKGGEWRPELRIF
jgi:hypothetical protein